MPPYYDPRYARQMPQPYYQQPQQDSSMDLIGPLLVSPALKKEEDDNNLTLTNLAALAPTQAANVNGNVDTVIAELKRKAAATTNRAKAQRLANLIQLITRSSMGGGGANGALLAVALSGGNLI